MNNLFISQNITTSEPIVAKTIAIEIHSYPPNEYDMNFGNINFTYIDGNNKSATFSGGWAENPVPENITINAGSETVQFEVTMNIFGYHHVNEPNNFVKIFLVIVRDNNNNYLYNQPVDVTLNSGTLTNYKFNVSFNPSNVDSLSFITQFVA